MSSSNLTVSFYVVGLGNGDTSRMFQKWNVTESETIVPLNVNVKSEN